MNEAFLNGKRILFIGQVFYDYHEKIIAQLRKFGAEVDFFENKTFVADPKVSNNIFSKISRTINPNFKKTYNQQIIDVVKDKEYDFLFCIGLFSITPYLIETLKKGRSNMKTILYLWDSFSIWDYSDLLPLFDRCFSFDYMDCNQFENLNYWPLFYSEEYTDNVIDNEKNEEIAILYIGSLSVASLNRVKLLSWLEIEMNSLELKSYLWLFVPLRGRSLVRKVLYKFKSALDKDYSLFWKLVEQYSLSHNFIKRKSLSRDEIIVLMNQTKCVLDITIPNQSGLTMRTIEALANGKKLITNNHHIIQESFYDPSIIFILDEKDLAIDYNFISSEKKKPSIENLRLDNWIKKLLTN